MPRLVTLAAPAYSSKYYGEDDVKRAVFCAPGEVHLTEQPRPTADGDDMLLVAVRACGLCTWEQRVYRGDKPNYPFAGGHEIGGVVAGPSDKFALGSIVAVSRLPRCRTCATCISGHDNLCAYNTGEMAEPDGPGGLAEYLVASERDIVALPKRSPAEATLVEPLACVLNSLDAAGVQEDTRLAIIGNGVMGVLHARAASSAGASVTLLRTHPTPDGLDGVWSGESIDVNESHLSESSVFDAVILVRDALANLLLAGEMARPGGIVSVFASLPPTDVIELPKELLRRKELRLTVAASHREVDFNAAAKKINDGKVKVDDLIHHRRFRLADVSEALRYATSRDSGRIIVEMDPAEQAIS